MKITLKKDIKGDILFSCRVSRCEVKEGKLFLKGFYFAIDSLDYDFKDVIFYLKDTKENNENLKNILRK